MDTKNSIRHIAFSSWLLRRRNYIFGMKKILLPCLAAIALLAGCGKDSKTAKTVEGVSNVVNAPMNYISTAVDAQKSMEKKIDVTSLTQDIQQFNVQEGRYPKDLNELVTEHYISKLPEPPFGYKLDYDSKNGSVSVVKE